MNKFAEELKRISGLTETTNGAKSYDTTMSGIYDLYAFGAAMRNHSDGEIIDLFKKAYNENKLYALRLLFYIRDAIGGKGQGERRFFRVCIKWLAEEDPEVIKKNIHLISEFGRWDDLYAFVSTPLEKYAFQIMFEQLKKDLNTDTPSLLAKWLKSENTSSADSVALARKTRTAFGLSSVEYRKTLSALRKKIEIVERKMSANEWDKIDYTKIPSKAGFLYRNAFIAHDGKRYLEIFQNKDTIKTLKTKALYPYDCVKQAFCYSPSEEERLVINSYWEAQTDFFSGATFNAIPVVDVSGSMTTNGQLPLSSAIALGLYCSERNKSLFKNLIITFSRNPSICYVDSSLDFYDKVQQIKNFGWGFNTDLEKTFDLIYKLIIDYSIPAEDIPKNLVIISDMQFDAACSGGYPHSETLSLLENIEKKWEAAGLNFPRLIFWNVNAIGAKVPMRAEKNVLYVSGHSASLFEQLLREVGPAELIEEIVHSERYSIINI